MLTKCLSISFFFARFTFFLFFLTIEIPSNHSSSNIFDIFKSCFFIILSDFVWEHVSFIRHVDQNVCYTDYSY